MSNHMIVVVVIECIATGSLVTTPFLPERPGIYYLRMRVIRARVVHYIMRNDVCGRAWL